MAITMNNHVFKGHKTLLGKKFVTLAELELPTRYDIFSKSKSGFGWGTRGSSSIQLSFSILYQLTNKKIAEENAVKFTVDIVSKLHSRNWILSSNDVLNWIDKHSEPMVEKIEPTKNVNKINKQKLNVVNSICQELDISQKRLSEILEIPERTVNSWAVKNEIPKIAKKALEYYMLNVKNQKIIDSYINSSKLQTTLKSFLKLHKEKA